MAQNKVYQYYTELPPLAKGVVVVGGLAVVYFAGTSILRKFKEAKLAKDSKESVKAADAEKRRLQNSGQRATYPKSQYQSWANAIHQAFEGCDPFGQIAWGKDSPLGGLTYFSNSGYKVITTLNQLKNDIDYLELVTAWGVRTYDACGWFMGNIKDVDFGKALQEELSSGEIGDINKLLSKKGITYRV